MSPGAQDWLSELRRDPNLLARGRAASRGLQPRAPDRQHSEPRGAGLPGGAAPPCSRHCSRAMLTAFAGPRHQHPGRPDRAARCPCRLETEPGSQGRVAGGQGPEIRSDPRTGLWAVPAPRPCRWRPRGFSQKAEPRKPEPRPWTLHGGDCATPAPPPRPRKALESRRPQPGAVGPRPPGDPAGPWPAFAGSELPSSQASVQWGGGPHRAGCPQAPRHGHGGPGGRPPGEQTLPRPRHMAWPSHSPDRYAKRFCSWSWMSAAQSGLMSWCMISSAGRAEQTETRCHLEEMASQATSGSAPPQTLEGPAVTGLEKGIPVSSRETFVSQSTESCALSDSSVFKAWCVSEAQRKAERVEEGTGRDTGAQGGGTRRDREGQRRTGGQRGGGGSGPGPELED